MGNDAGLENPASGQENYRSLQSLSKTSGAKSHSMSVLGEIFISFFLDSFRLRSSIKKLTLF